MSFVHLRVHSFYTLKEGTASPDTLAHQANLMGMPSLALTDTMNLYGAMSLTRAARREGIQAIVGAEVLVQGAVDVTTNTSPAPFARPVLLTANPTGYRHLCILLTRGHFTAHRNAPPAVELSDLSAYSKGLICLDGGPMGLVGDLLHQGDDDGALAAARQYREIFDPGCFYLELQNTAPPALNRSLLELARRLDLPVVATHPVYHAQPGEGLGTGGSPAGSSTSAPWSHRWGAHLLSPEEMARLFSEVSPALASTLEIAERCTNALPQAGSVLPPTYKTPDEDPRLVRELAFHGLAQHYPTVTPALSERLQRELILIQQMGLSGYFLILWDLIRWCKGRGIAVGPGRGSAVGSLTCYCLGITSVDPVRHNLYFERFLNPQRKDLPDVDIDLCSRRRPEALDYIARRYGPDHLAQVGVLSTLGARGALREAGRVLGADPALTQKLAAILPRSRGIGGIRNALASLPEFKRLDLESKPVDDILTTATFLEGMPTHMSIHAAGLVISPGPLSQFTPVELGGNGEIITQLQPDDLEALGLIKIDLLGLRNLTIIQDTVEMVTARGGPQLDPDAIPEDDPRTFEMLQKGESLGCFQLDSPGMRRLLYQVGPTCYEDLMAIISLYRPGPWEAGAVDAFVRRRQGKEPMPAMHTRLKPILEETYGMLLYQEQVMRAAVEIAGFTLAEADGLRRALGRGGSLAESYRPLFVAGAQGQGISPGEAEGIFNMLLGFSGYSFNKAHTVSYARITLQTAYLKAHCPTEYFAALLASNGGYYGSGVYAREAQRLKIPLLDPHINFSGFTFAPEGTAIRIGLLQVKGVGPASAAAIVQERKRRGHFSSLDDLRRQVRLSNAALDGLSRAGALEGLPVSPRQLNLFDAGLTHAGLIHAHEQAENQSPDSPHRPDGPRHGILNLGPQPSPNLQRRLERWGVLTASQLQGGRPGAQVLFSGTMVSSRRRTNNRGEAALEMLLQDSTGFVELTVPAPVYERDVLEIDPSGVVVRGKLLSTEPVPRMLVEAIRAWENLGSTRA